MRRGVLILTAVLAFGGTSSLPVWLYAQSAGAVTGQSPTPDQTIKADARVLALLAEAEKSRLALRFDEAQERVGQATTLAEQIGDRVGLAAAHRMKGSLLNWSGRTAEGTTWLNRALAESEEIGDHSGMAGALMGLTTIAIKEGKVPEANAFGARAMQLLQAIGDEPGRATVLINLVSASGQAKADDPRIAEVLAVADRFGDDNLRATALRLRGAQQFNDGDLAGAKATLDAAVEAYQRAGDISGTAAAYLMTGRVIRMHNDFEGALRYYQRAIDLLAPTGERYTLVEAVNASAVALGQLGRHGEAIAAYERGLALARESGNPRLIDFMLGNLGGGLTVAKEYARAVPVLEEVLSRKPEPYIAAFRHHQLAAAFHELKRDTEALPHSNAAIQLTRDLGQTDNLDDRLDLRSKVFESLGKLDEALRDSIDALSVIDKVRARLLPVDFLKRGFGDRAQEYHARGVDLLLRLGRGPEALELAERGRARALLDLLAARESASATLTTRSATPGAPGPSNLRSDTFAQPLALDGMRGVAARLNTTLLMYWVNDANTIVWTIEPNGKIWSSSLAVSRTRLTDLVAATTALLREPPRPVAKPAAGAARPAGGTEPAEPDVAAVPLRGLGLLALANDDRTAWRELDAALIEPIRAHLPPRGGRVTIIPHGPLSNLAFAALQAPSGRYLIEDFDLSAAPSVSVLAFTGRRQDTERSGTPGPWLLVGNPSVLPQVGGRALAPLPGAGQEIAAIAALAPRKTAVRLDADGADEDALMRALDTRHPSIVHFATHGFVPDDPKAPPFLVMNRRGPNANQDGQLTMDEIYGLTLTSDLVVLSACRTGAGAISSDGVIGLARAFFYAGTPSVMATFWDVPDVTTAILMPRFYRGYVATGAKSRSLRAAQLALLADLRAGRIEVTVAGRRIVLPEHPLLWAGFFMSGEP